MVIEVSPRLRNEGEEVQIESQKTRKEQQEAKERRRGNAWAALNVAGAPVPHGTVQISCTKFARIQIRVGRDVAFARRRKSGSTRSRERVMPNLPRRVLRQRGAVCTLQPKTACQDIECITYHSSTGCFLRNDNNKPLPLHSWSLTSPDHFPQNNTHPEARKQGTSRNRTHSRDQFTSG